MCVCFWHIESFPHVSIRYTGSRFARDLEIIIALYCAGCLKTLRFVSIRLNRQESVSLLVSSSHFAGCRFARDLENRASLYYIGWVEKLSIRFLFDETETNRFLCYLLS